MKKQIITLALLLIAIISYSQTWESFYKMPNKDTPFGRNLKIGTMINETDSSAMYQLTHAVTARDSMATAFDSSWVTRITVTGASYWSLVNNTLTPSTPTDTVYAKQFYVGPNGLKFDAEAHYTYDYNSDYQLMRMTTDENNSNFIWLGTLTNTIFQTKITDFYSNSTDMNWHAEVGDVYQSYTVTTPTDQDVIRFDSTGFYQTSTSDLNLGTSTSPWDTTFSTISKAGKFVVTGDTAVGDALGTIAKANGHYYIKIALTGSTSDRWKVID